MKNRNEVAFRQFSDISISITNMQRFPLGEILSGHVWHNREEAFKVHFLVEKSCWGFRNLELPGFFSNFFSLPQWNIKEERERCTHLMEKVVSTNVSLPTLNVLNLPSKGTLQLTSWDVPQQVCFVSDNEEVLRYLLSLKVLTSVKVRMLLYLLQQKHQLSINVFFW